MYVHNNYTPHLRIISRAEVGGERGRGRSNFRLRLTCASTSTHGKIKIVIHIIGSELIVMASEEETILASSAENVSNLTGRAAATAEGIALTYSSLFVMALGPILLGSMRSVLHRRSLLVSECTRGLPQSPCCTWVSRDFCCRRGASRLRTR